MICLCCTVDLFHLGRSAQVWGRMRLRGFPRNLKAPVSGAGRGRISPHRNQCCVPFSIFSCLFLTLLLVFHLTRDKQPWEFRTAAGDNLVPTPWHKARRDGHILPWDNLRRKAQVAWCSTSICNWPLQTDDVVDGEGEEADPSRERLECPAYFHWIYDDLSAWKQAGISEASVLAAREFAAFRVVILKGRLYVDYYYKCVQSRGLFTVWSLVLLLERFPGQVPDVDFMFDCMDRPHISKSEARQPGVLPALFRYCTTDNHLDIPFPDWSFWGWPEIGLRPWDEEREGIFKGSEEMEWEDRAKFAYWKGNPNVDSSVREQLLLCNASVDPSFNAHIYRQDWMFEAASGFKSSKIADQCKHRFMIYSEGHAWSVSYKYIMSCGSPLLSIDSDFYEFYTRALLPAHHFLPVKRSRLCSSIKDLVDMGNRNPLEMEALGKRAQKFLSQDLSMENVYSYMLHLLTEYSRLLTYQPSVPPGAEHVCRSKILCVADSRQLYFMVKNDPHAGSGAGESSSRRMPCTMPAFNSSYFQETESFKQQMDSHLGQDFQSVVAAMKKMRM